MNKIDIRPLIKEIKYSVERHELPERKGAYCRWLWQAETGKPRELGINEYGCADAANILYTINDFYCDPETRAARVDALKSLQDPETGMYTEATHHTIHTTAHCTAALQLFDEKPLYPVKGLHKYFDKEELYAFLEGLNWAGDPWGQSHRGAGIYAALVNADEITEEFSKNYFEWLWENADEVSGFWKKSVADKAPYSNARNVDGYTSMYPIMAGSFHYLFNHEYAKMPLRYPDKVIDSCIKMYTENGLSPDFGKNCNFIEIDWIYCMTRAARQTSHRNDEVRALVWDMAEKYLDYLLKLDHRTHDRFNDLHMLFGVCCALAELQSFFPGRIITEKPLKLVLDRRPFI